MGYTAKGCAGTLLSPIWHGAASHHRTHALFAPSGVSAGQDSNVLGRGFNSCYIPQEWQQQVQEPAEQGHGWLMGNLGIAGGKAAWLSALPPQTQPALGPHSPETDKSYRKRGDLSLRLAWLVSAQRGEWSTTQRAGALQLQGLRATLSAACHSPGAQGLLSDAREGTNSPGTSEQPQLRPSVMATCSLMCSWRHHIPSSWPPDPHTVPVPLQLFSGKLGWLLGEPRVSRGTAMLGSLHHPLHARERKLRQREGRREQLPPKE